MSILDGKSGPSFPIVGPPLGSRKKSRQQVKRRCSPPLPGSVSVLLLLQLDLVSHSTHTPSHIVPAFNITIHSNANSRLPPVSPLGIVSIADDQGRHELAPLHPVILSPQARNTSQMKRKRKRKRKEVSSPAQFRANKRAGYLSLLLLLVVTTSTVDGKNFARRT
jgi:hypothetical protein